MDPKLLIIGINGGSLADRTDLTQYTEQFAVYFHVCMHVHMYVCNVFVNVFMC